MDEAKRELTPQEREANLMGQYAEAQGPEQLLRETVAALLDAACTLKCEMLEKDEGILRRFGLYDSSSESLARAALLLDVVSMALEDAEVRAIDEDRVYRNWKFRIAQKEAAELFRRKQETEPDEDQ